jgi:hypothetical protein
MTLRTIALLPNKSIIWNANFLLLRQQWVLCTARSMVGRSLATERIPALVGSTVTAFADLLYLFEPMRLPRAS